MKVMGISKFTASSGRTVRVGEDGTIMFDHANGYLSPQSAMDAEEFYQARRDEELGRWRYPLDPRYVVYADEDGDVYVLDEIIGIMSSLIVRADMAQRNPDHLVTQAARAYFDAHPERKPWEDAEHGEVWVVTIGDKPEIVTYVDRMLTTFPRFIDPSNDKSYGPHSGLTSGRRIWPAEVQA